MKIEHIAMYVKDIETAKDFFVKYLGGKSNNIYHNPKTEFSSYFISFENGSRLELMTKPDLIEQSNTHNCFGYIHIAFSVGSKENVDLITEKLRDDGFEIKSGPRTTGDGYYESSVVAVDGNLIEITI